MQFTMPGQQYNNKEYLSTVLETMKQKMLARAATSATTTASSATTTASSAEAMGTREIVEIATTTSATTASDIVSIPFGEFIIGVGYILLILVFVTRVFFKTLNWFTKYYSSSSSYYSASSQNRGDRVYNRFGFMINAESDSEFSSDEEEEEEEEEEDEKYATTTVLSHSLSSLSSPLPKKKHLPQTPQSPPPPLRRSKRLQMKSEMNLTMLVEKQTQTSSSSSKILFPSVSSEPLPKRSSSFISPSPHPEHDEELAFEINRRYEKRMQKRSECNSPPLIRRLIL